MSNIESYLETMRRMNELAVSTAEERFSSLRHPSHHHPSSGDHLHPHPPPPASTTTPATTPATPTTPASTIAVAAVKGTATTGVGGGERAGVAVGIKTADQEVAHAPIQVDDKALVLRGMETDTLSPLLGESILAGWDKGEGGVSASVIAGSSTHNNDTTLATSVAVKEGAVPNGKGEVGVDGGVVTLGDLPSSTAAAGVKNKKRSSVMSSSASVQSHSPSQSTSLKSATAPSVQGVCRLEMEMIRRHAKHQQSNHHLTAVSKHLWFVSYVIKLQETTSLSHQEIPPRLVVVYNLYITTIKPVIFILMLSSSSLPSFTILVLITILITIPTSCLRLLGVIHRLLTHGFAEHLDVVLFYRILEDTVVDPNDYHKPLVHRTIFCVAEYVHVGPEAFMAYLEEKKITPCSELLAQVREIKDRRERHRKRKEKEKRLSSDHLNDMSRVGSKHRKGDHRTHKTAQDNNSSPESGNDGGEGRSRPRGGLSTGGTGGSGVWMVGSPESPDDHDYSASDSNRNSPSPTSSGRPSPTANMFRTRSGWSGSIRYGKCKLPSPDPDPDIYPFPRPISLL